MANIKGKLNKVFENQESSESKEQIMNHYIVTVEVADERKNDNPRDYHPTRTRVRSQEIAPSEKMARYLAERRIGGRAIYCDLLGEAKDNNLT